MNMVIKKYTKHSLPSRYKKSRVSSKKFNKRINQNNEVLNKAKNL
jgi:hypothetical protein